jgi:hypothetical protein
MMLERRDQPSGSDASVLRRGTVTLSIPELDVSLSFEMTLFITWSCGTGTVSRVPAEADWEGSHRIGFSS